MVCSGQLLLVKPAPTVEISNIYARVFPWVGAGLRDCLFGAIIVGETRPYGGNIKHICEGFFLGGGGFERWFVRGNYCG